MTVSEQLRQAVLACKNRTYPPMGLREITKASGVSPSTVSRFLLGKSVDSDILDKLAAWMGMELLPPRMKEE